MDIILHLGAHRTATTTFQHYVRDNRRALMRHRIGYWGPHHTRTLVFPDFFRKPNTPQNRQIAASAAERIDLLLQNAEGSGFQTLLISDENLLGTCAGNLRQAELYPSAGQRVAQIAGVFGERLRKIVLSVRSLEEWWTSACALSFRKDHRFDRLPDFDRIASRARSWRALITGIAQAAPGAELLILPFEKFKGHQEHQLEVITGHPAPPDRQRRWLNSGADLGGLRVFGAADTLSKRQNGRLPLSLGQWQPFTPMQKAQLHETYLDDLFWLASGADGLATLSQMGLHNPADMRQSGGKPKRGRDDDKGQLARHGQSGVAGT
jgi:hypothetical protein